MAAIWLSFGLCLSILGHTNAASNVQLECYACDDVLSPNDCTYSTDFCGEDDTCSTILTPLGPLDELRYVLGCTSKRRCDIVKNMTGNNLCFECCDTPRCNNDLCSKNVTTRTTPRIMTATPTTITPTPALPYTQPPSTYAPYVSLSAFITHRLGNSFSIRCSYSGNPSPHLQWYFNGHTTLPSNAHVQTVPGYSNLQLDHSILDNKGNYTCQASNSVGTATSITQLILTGKEPIFIERPTGHLTMTKDSGTYPVRCRATGNPPPTVHWGFHLGPQTIMALSAIHPNSDQTQLNISQPPQELSGGYITCTYTNAFGSISTNMTLSVIVPTTTPITTTATMTAPSPVLPHTTAVPLIITLPSLYNVTIGHYVAIPCRATGSPPPRITWSQLVGQFPSNVEQHDNKLFIANAGPANSQIYVCTAENIHGNVIKPTRVIVQGVAPSITSRPTTQRVPHSDSVRLVCGASGDPTPTITWTWNPAENTIVVDDANLRLIPGVSIDNNGLTIAHAYEAHSGVYICTATNAYGSTIAEALLIVSPAHVNVAPRISATPLVTTAVYGSPVVIHYHTSGDPTPTTTCLFKNTLLPSDVHMTGDQLVISSVTDKDSGSYYCTTQNTEGSDMVKIQITVTGVAPSFVARPVTKTVLFGTHSSLRCIATGVPPPNISWEYRNGFGRSHLPAGTTMSHDKTVLTIKSIQEAGTYVCHADNPYGHVITQASIYVKTGTLIG